MMLSQQLRDSYIDFFVSHQHKHLPAGPVVPSGDGSLLFTNAGMVQFKDIFLNTALRSYPRAVTAQPCLRVGGKHNDLENIGFTHRHLTMFEMMGNFSFADYFKEEAISMAWEYVHKTLQLSPEKLWVTVHHSDQESRELWRKISGLKDDRIISCGDEDNFWSMGPTGPCGPSSEIFYDLGPSVAGGPPGSADADGDRFLEIWNLVFMQYVKHADQPIQPLAHPCVDTGMGLERIAAVMQGVVSNFETDQLRDFIASIKSAYPILSTHSLRVIADHVRSICFMMSAEIRPGNEGRAYVLRRIIRRAMRFGVKDGIDAPFLHQIVAIYLRSYGSQYDLFPQHDRIIEPVAHEEKQFYEVLTRGMASLQKVIQASPKGQLDGDKAFQLYDTYGMPLDIMLDVAKEHQVTFDQLGFDEAMQEQQERSRAHSHFKSQALYPIHAEHTEFLGYEHLSSASKIIKLLDDEHQVVDTLDSSGYLLLDQSPFYAESGGQVADHGKIRCADGLMEVVDVQKQGECIIHQVKLLQGHCKTGDTVEAEVDTKKRHQTAVHHTATHLLHAALRAVLGDEVAQKGSLVTDQRLRFDFSCSKLPGADDQLAIEQLVNHHIRQNWPVSTEVLPLDEAKKRGAMALFGEKYAETVRLLSIDTFSLELCGGTHVSHTGEIGMVKIVSMGTIANGIRRLEAVAGIACEHWIDDQVTLLNQVAQQLGTATSGILEKLAKNQQDFDKLQAEMKQSQDDKLLQCAKSQTLRQHQDLHYFLGSIPCASVAELRSFTDHMNDLQPCDLVVAFAAFGERITLICSSRGKKVNCRALSQAIFQHFAGKGGGREDFAQGALPLQGPQGTVTEELLQQVVLEHLSA